MVPASDLASRPASGSVRHAPRHRVTFSIVLVYRPSVSFSVPAPATSRDHHLTMSPAVGSLPFIRPHQRAPEALRQSAVGRVYF